MTGDCDVELLAAAIHRAWNDRHPELKSFSLDSPRFFRPCHEVAMLISDPTCPRDMPRDRVVEELQRAGVSDPGWVGRIADAIEELYGRPAIGRT